MFIVDFESSMLLSHFPLCKTTAAPQWFVEETEKDLLGFQENK